MKTYVTITFYSFGIVVLLTALFHNFDIAPDLKSRDLLILFLISATISAVMLLMEYIQDRFFQVGAFLDGAIKLLICYVVVFFVGTSLSLFDFSWYSAVCIIPLTILTFAFTYIITYFTNVEYSKEINKRIKSKRQS